MSSQVTEAFVKQFSANVFMLAQQRGSRLRPFTRQETQVGTSKSFNRLGAVTATKSTTRHGDTPQTDTPHSTRWVFTSNYKHADLIDEADKRRMLINPAGPYAQAFMWAFGRAWDDEILSALSGTAVTGVGADGSASLGNSQKIVPVSGAAGANLSVAALIRAKGVFWDNDVEEDAKLHIAVNSSALQALLNQTQVTSKDYNTVQALVRGEINEYMGFTFHRSQRLLTQSGSLAFSTSAGTVGAGTGDADTYKKIVCWAEDAIVSSAVMEPKTRIGERADKSYSEQVYMEMDVGAVRLEEEKVVEILCNQA